MADKIKAVFLAALDTPIDERPTYLDRACGGDADVRRRVEALLRAHDGPNRLLDRPAWCPTPERDGRPTPGDAPAGSRFWKPYVKNMTIMNNSAYNGYRYEDLWLDK